MTRTSCRSLLVTFGLVAMVASLALARAEQAGVDARGQAPAAAGAAPAIDVFVTDKDGRTPDSLRPADLAITVDGKPRDVLWIRRVSRGPGAVSDATARAARGDAGMTIAAEPIRNVIVVVDQATLVQGDERAAVQASGALVDRLGIADRVAVLRLPFSAGQQVALTT
ncbi:MAG: hypothetical protein NTY02_00130, partial [Acidobacteria bacterium]|nr:hypothetical protein [Acidobacteriota bacterium]